MQVVAILEKRPMHWYVYIPAVGCGSPLPERIDAEAAATALIVAATGVPAADVHISLQLAGQADTLLPSPRTDVEVRHKEGTWRSAQHLGWLRLWDGSWRPLVSYAAEGVMWERAVHPSCFRQLDRGTPALPVPRHSASGTGGATPQLPAQQRSVDDAGRAESPANAAAS